MTTRVWPAAMASLAILLPAASARSQAEQEPIHLEQGWDAGTREAFYFTAQGSRIMPHAWFMALERPDGAGRFADPAHLEGFGLIPAPPSPLNPDGLPVGIAVEPGEPAQMGLNCAACHTGAVHVEGRTIRVDGGPANFDFDRFYAALARAVTATLFDADRFARFAAAVGAGDPAALRADFAAFQQRLAGDAALRRPALASGFGRVDALTQIVNSLAVRDQGEPANLHPVAAPTSYPPLWLAHELEFVQWNPVASSPIARNAGQVLGVFGVTDLRPGTATPLASTMLIDALYAYESWVATLTPPPWDESILGPIDRDLADRGAAIFADACAGCHNMAPWQRTPAEENHFGRTFIKIGRVDYRTVGTDPTYILSLSQRLVRTNPLTAPLFGGQEVVPATAFFPRMVGAVVESAMARQGLGPEERAAYHGFRLRRTASGVPEPYLPPSFTDLKAPPLAGTWATGPYLHNGSVPTVYELLSPPAERRAVFWTGGRALDRARLGFASDEAPGRFRFDTSLSGNGNQGHEFPRAGFLAPEDRLAVIEYLKTQ